ncbi:MAG: site-specific DNA-methyltransferase [Bdellovibrionaceae bacterium]|nr:site-specific DNA-methyltransferase [Pseudobdellovibrionaceae bacterium]
MMHPEPSRKLKAKINEESVPAKKRGNELDGKRWIQNSISIWSDLSKEAEEKKLDHPATFPWKLAARIIETFTNSNQRTILDPFVGIGSTLAACHMLNKDGIGLDISKDYISAAQKRIKQLPPVLAKRQSKIQLIQSDALNVLNHVKRETVDLCFTSPPYWNVLTQKRSADMKEVRDYVRPKGNIGHIESYEEYILAMQEIFERVYETLKPNAYCVVNVMDLRKKDMFFPLHMDLSRALIEVGFELDDIIIWDRRKDYNNFRPLGYPAVFRVNKAHEFLLIFQKKQRWNK